MKKRMWILALFSILILIAAGITTVVCAREYTAGVYYLYDISDDTKITDTHFTTENDHVELKDVRIDNGIVKATFIPKSFGYDTVTFYTQTNDPALDNDVPLRFLSGPFGTLFSFDPQIDFKGSI